MRHRRIAAGLTAALLAIALLPIGAGADHNDGGVDEQWVNAMNQPSYWETRYDGDGFSVECTKFEGHQGNIAAGYELVVVHDGQRVRVYHDPNGLGRFTALGPVNPANGKHHEPPHSWIMKCNFIPDPTTPTEPTTPTTVPSTTVPPTTVPPTTTPPTTEPPTTTVPPTTEPPGTTVPDDGFASAECTDEGFNLYLTVGAWTVQAIDSNGDHVWIMEFDVTEDMTVNGLASFGFPRDDIVELRAHDGDETTVFTLADCVEDDQTTTTGDDEPKATPSTDPSRLPHTGIGTGAIAGIAAAMMAAGVAMAARKDRTGAA